MINVKTTGARLADGVPVEPLPDCLPSPEDIGAAREKTIAYRIMRAHEKGSSAPDAFRISFDALVSHDITYVGIIQTARASGMTRFPLPTALTCCHNSLCAVGGTINEDDHVFGLSAAQKYGGLFVPAHVAVIHQYAREVLAAGGGMILGSDSHTRYGALGCMGFGEGGGELVKQLVGRTYDIAAPEVVAVWLTGTPRPGVGPHDVALALVGKVFDAGLVKNRILEFMGPGVSTLSVDYRLGIDVMTTETACLSSIWSTDDKVRQWLAAHGRAESYKELAPLEGAWYDRVIRIELDKVEPMIALPFHPGNAWPISTFRENAADLLHKVEQDAQALLGASVRGADLQSKLRNGEFHTDQAVVAGCAGGTFENITRMAALLEGRGIGVDRFRLSVYPSSRPVSAELMRTGAAAGLMSAGATWHTAFCGPCFGAGDVPCHNGFSIRHTTRNFPNREGSKPTAGQIAFVALMDARSIAATALNGGRLTSALDVEWPEEKELETRFDADLYKRSVYNGWGRARPEVELVRGPNIVDWPAMEPLPESLLLQTASAITDPVTTTDELIPSGESSSYRSNPLKMAEFTLSRKDPGYVDRAKAVQALETARRNALRNKAPLPEDVAAVFAAAGLAGRESGCGLGTLVFALRPGDGSAREQAASCQKVLGGWADIAGDYATKRYRSNLVNWGLLPFVLDNAAEADIRVGDFILVSGIRAALQAGSTEIAAEHIRDGRRTPLTLRLPGLTPDERDVILAGSLINYYQERNR